MTKMIERVARAIDDNSGVGLGPARMLARAAIEAMREPNGQAGRFRLRNAPKRRETK